MNKNIFITFLTTLFVLILTPFYYFKSHNLNDVIFKFLDIEPCSSQGEVLSNYLYYLDWATSSFAIIFYFLAFGLYLFFKYKNAEEENKDKRKFYFFLCLFAFVSFISSYISLSYIISLGFGPEEICFPGVPDHIQTY